MKNRLSMLHQRDDNKLQQNINLALHVQHYGLDFQDKTIFIDNALEVQNLQNISKYYDNSLIKCNSNTQCQQINKVKLKISYLKKYTDYFGMKYFQI